MALTYDAVQLFAQTLKNLPFKPVPQNCSQRTESVRDDGSSFKNYMRTVNRKGGISYKIVNIIVLVIIIAAPHGTFAYGSHLL